MTDERMERVARAIRTVLHLASAREREASYRAARAAIDAMFPLQEGVEQRVEGILDRLIALEPDDDDMGCHVIGIKEAAREIALSLPSTAREEVIEAKMNAFFDTDEADALYQDYADGKLSFAHACRAAAIRALKGKPPLSAGAADPKPAGENKLGADRP